MYCSSQSDTSVSSLVSLPVGSVSSLPLWFSQSHYYCVCGYVACTAYETHCQPPGVNALPALFIINLLHAVMLPIRFYTSHKTSLKGTDIPAPQSSGLMFIEALSWSVQMQRVLRFL